MLTNPNLLEANSRSEEDKTHAENHFQPTVALPPESELGNRKYSKAWVELGKRMQPKIDLSLFVTLANQFSSLTQFSEDLDKKSSANLFLF